MPIHYPTLKGWSIPAVEQSYTERDTMLYALGLGLGLDPIDPRELRFVYEDGLRALPTMAVVLGYAGFWLQDPALGVDWKRVLHGEEALEFHRPFAPAGTVVGVHSIDRVIDKGAGRGALIVWTRTLYDKPSGAKLATVTQTTFCRAEGGFEGGDAPLPAPAAVPERVPDQVCDRPTPAQMALVYRLSADRNPLHADPAVAAEAGYPRPILHGLATLGVAGFAILKTLCDCDPTRLRTLSVRFSAPVYPGETIRTEIWRERERIAFRARVLERDVVVLDRGSATLAG